MRLLAGSGARSFLIALLLGVVGCTVPSPPTGPYSMQVHGVRLDPRTSSPVLLLTEQDGLRRRLPIWIGLYEAQSIAIGMEKTEASRPNTHDLIRNILDGLKGKVARVIITELRKNTYYAVVEIEVNGRTVSIDSRPSDAVAVAVRMGAPVFATRDVLEAAGHRSEDDPAMEIRWPAIDPGPDGETREH